MDITREQLKAELNFDQIFNQVFEEAVALFLEELIGEADFGIPFDSGNLLEGIQVDEINSDQYQATLISTATSETGFDYPELLNNASNWVIEPVNANALAFSVGGQQVFTKRVEIDNEHVGWWDEHVLGNQEAWERALQTAGLRAGVL